jgi:hypothetical protein
MVLVPGRFNGAVLMVHLGQSVHLLLVLLILAVGVVVDIMLVQREDHKVVLELV